MLPIDEWFVWNPLNGSPDIIGNLANIPLLIDEQHFDINCKGKDNNLFLSIAMLRYIHIIRQLMGSDHQISACKYAHIPKEGRSDIQVNLWIKIIIILLIGLQLHLHTYYLSIQTDFLYRDAELEPMATISDQSLVHLDNPLVKLLTRLIIVLYLALSNGTSEVLESVISFQCLRRSLGSCSLIMCIDRRYKKTGYSSHRNINVIC